MYSLTIKNPITKRFDVFNFSNLTSVQDILNTYKKVMGFANAPKGNLFCTIEWMEPFEEENNNGTHTTV